MSFVLLSQPLNLLLADGQGNVLLPAAASGGQHTSPAHELPEPGHSTRSPCRHVPIASGRDREGLSQSWTFAPLSQPSKLLLADGQGKVKFPDEPVGGQHWSPAHVAPEPGHLTVSPRLHVPPREADPRSRCGIGAAVVALVGITDGAALGAPVGAAGGCRSNRWYEAPGIWLLA